MKQDKITYETGATSHAVNDLILFTDNTRELAELRDNLYKDWVETGNFGTSHLYERFISLFNAACEAYNKEFKYDPDSCHAINLLDHSDCIEYCQLYVKDFENWKSEHGDK